MNTAIRSIGTFGGKIEMVYCIEGRYVQMEFPEDVLCVIREYSKPACRLDWRRGSYICRTYTSPESDFHSDLLMKVHDWRENNLTFEDYVISFNQLYDAYPIWKNTYHAYFHPEIVSLFDNGF